MSLKDQGIEAAFESHAWKGERTDKRITAEVQTSHNTTGGIGRFSRNLFPNCDAPLKAVLASIEQVRQIHERNSVPWGLTRAVRIEHYPRHRDRTKDAIAQFDVALKNLYDLYPTMVTTGLANSNGLSTPDEYLAQSDIYSRFGVSITYSQLTDAGDWLKATMLTPTEQQELVAQTQDAERRNLAAMKDHLKDQFARILIQARSNLSKTVTKADGQRFNVGWLLNLQQFCELWPSLNLDQDPLIPVMLADLQPILQHSPETMKTSDQAKAVAHSTLEHFIATHDSWLNS